MPDKLTTEEFINRSRDIHGDLYDYSKVEYINSITKVCIICKDHGEFWMRPINHYYKSDSTSQGCPMCGHTRKGINRRVTREDFISRSNEIHKGKFSYDKVVMGKDNKEKVIINCPIHGDFTQQLNGHLNGLGCRKCSEGTLSVEQFIKEATAVHDGKYDYSKVHYDHMLDKVIIICPEHGEFTQQPFYHLRRVHGCPLCSSLVSKRETIWLDRIGIPHEFRQFEILNGKYKADGYDPKTKTVYEFYGDYWHGNPKTFDKNEMNKQANKTYGVLYRETIEREEEIKSHGYKVVAVWESELY
jgi:hypothetical protein